MGPSQKTDRQREHLTMRGERLAALRREAGLTQQELADVVGIDQSSLSRMERGRHGMVEVVKVRIADALGVEPERVWPLPSFEEIEEGANWK